MSLFAGGSFLGNGFFGGFSAENVEEGGGDGEAEYRGADEAADDDDGHGVQDFLAGLVGCEEEGDEGDACGEGRHDDGDEAFEGAAFEHLAGEAFALVAHEMEVVGDHHDVVAGCDAGDGDEANEGGDADIVESLAGVEDGADEGDRDDGQDEGHEAEVLKVAVEEEDDNEENDGGGGENGVTRFLLGLILAFK